MGGSTEKIEGSQRQFMGVAENNWVNKETFGVRPEISETRLGLTQQLRGKQGKWTANRYKITVNNEM